MSKQLCDSLPTLIRSCIAALSGHQIRAVPFRVNGDVPSLKTRAAFSSISSESTSQIRPFDPKKIKFGEKGKLLSANEDIWNSSDLKQNLDKLPNESETNEDREKQSEKSNKDDDEPTIDFEHMYDSRATAFVLGFSLVGIHRLAKGLLWRTDEEPWKRQSGEPLCVFRQICPLASAKPMLTGQSVLPHQSLNKRTTNTSKSIYVQTEPTALTEDLEAATKQLQNAICFKESSVYNKIGLDLLRRGLQEEAFRYFTRASISQLPTAIYNLALCYAKGYGTGININEAVELWNETAQNGHAESIYQIGVCHMKGLGSIEKNKEIGAAMIEEAAQLGVAEAQFYTGIKSLKRGKKQTSISMIRQAIINSDEGFFGNALLQKWHKGGNIPAELIDNVKDNNNSQVHSKNETKSKTNVKRSKFWASFDSDSTLPTDGVTDQTENSDSIVFEDCTTPVNTKPHNISSATIHRSSTVHDFRRQSVFLGHLGENNFVACET